MVVKVLFFGVLAEVTGTAVKHYSDVRSATHLMFRIEDDFPGFIHHASRIMVNNDFTDDDVQLSDGDEVGFIPLNDNA
jgi:molybdopterin converting factor small subunit